MWQRLLCRAASPTRDGGRPSAARPRLSADSFLHHLGSTHKHHMNCMCARPTASSCRPVGLCAAPRRGSPERPAT